MTEQTTDTKKEINLLPKEHQKLTHSEKHQEFIDTIEELLVLLATKRGISFEFNQDNLIEVIYKTVKNLPEEYCKEIFPYAYQNGELSPIYLEVFELHIINPYILEGKIHVTEHYSGSKLKEIVPGVFKVTEQEPYKTTLRLDPSMLQKSEPDKISRKEIIPGLFKIVHKDQTPPRLDLLESELYSALTKEKRA